MVMQGSFELQGSRGFGEASCRKKAARPAVFARASIDAPWSASAHLFSQPGRNLKGHEGPSAMRSMRPMLANNTRGTPNGSTRFLRIWAKPCVQPVDTERPHQT
jgi:hypothetical protein